MEDKKVPEKKKWYFTNTALVVGFLCVGPFILPLAWINPKSSRARKIVITVVIILATYLFYLLMAGSIASISDSYKLMSEMLNNR